MRREEILRICDRFIDLRYGACAIQEVELGCDVAVKAVIIVADHCDELEQV